jgi:hypothetical protein
LPPKQALGKIALGVMQDVLAAPDLLRQDILYFRFQPIIRYYSPTQRPHLR